MKLSEQIALLTKTLDEFGYDIGDGESAGEVAAEVIRELELAYGKDRVVQLQDRIAQLETELEGAQETIEDVLMGKAPEPDPMADVPAGPVIPCDECTYLDMGKTIPRLCQNLEAIRHHFARRGYSVAAEHGCTLGRS